MGNITKNQQVLLKLLSHVLFNRELDVQYELDWNELFREATTQTVLPLIYEAVSGIMPFGEKEKWKLTIFKMLANNVQVLYEHKYVHEIFSRENIPYTIIKGAASAKHYPEPKLRIMGDVDFVVRKEDLFRAGKLLERYGFTCTKDQEHPAHLVYYRGSSIWEMHWSLSGIPTGENGLKTKKYFGDIIETAVFDSAGYMVPDDFHHGLVMLIHMARHLLNTGIGIRHICDWAVFVEKFSEKEFIEIYEEKLKACGLWHFAQIITQLSVHYLGGSDKKWAETGEDKAYLESVISDIFAGGNFGVKDSERINQAKLITSQGKGNVENVFFGSQFIQTMNEKAFRALPMANKLPFLIPFGWLYVGTRHFIRIKKRTRPAIHPGKMIEGAIERREIYKQFHLFEEEKRATSKLSQNRKFGFNSYETSSSYDRLKKWGMPVYRMIKNSILRKPCYYLQDGLFMIRYWLYGSPHISKEDIHNVENSVTFLFKSFQRQKQARRLYRCIRRYYPQAMIIIVDDSREPFKLYDKYLTVLHLPFNSGLGKGLAEGLEKVSTSYVMRMDDDELLTPKSRIHDQLKYLQKNDSVDLVGFQVTHLDRKRLIEQYRKVRMNRQLKIAAGTVIDGKEVIYKPANVYLVRTEKLRQVGYDPNIRMIDHNEFFYRAAGEIVCVMDETAFIMHCHNWFEAVDYDAFREDWKGDARYIAIKHREL